MRLTSGGRSTACVRRSATPGSPARTTPAAMGRSWCRVASTAGWRPPAAGLYDSYADPNTRAIKVYDNTDSSVVQAAFTSGGLRAQTTSLTAAADQLSVATYNVENLNPQNAASNLKAPNLIAVEEVQDNSGATDDGTVSASTTLSMLTSAISAAGGPSYLSTGIDPANDADGGQPGGNIRQVFLYNPAAVTLVSRLRGPEPDARPHPGEWPALRFGVVLARACECRVSPTRRAITILRSPSSHRPRLPRPLRPAFPSRRLRSWSRWPASPPSVAPSRCAAAVVQLRSNRSCVDCSCDVSRADSRPLLGFGSQTR